MNSFPLEIFLGKDRNKPSRSHQGALKVERDLEIQCFLGKLMNDSIDIESKYMSSVDYFKVKK